LSAPPAQQSDMNEREGVNDQEQINLVVDIAVEAFQETSIGGALEKMHQSTVCGGVINNETLGAKGEDEITTELELAETDASANGSMSVAVGLQSEEELEKYSEHIPNELRLVKMGLRCGDKCSVRFVAVNKSRLVHHCYTL